MRKVDQDNFLQELSRKNEKALEYVVDVYGGLIKTIVKRHLRGLTDYQEECINDVFLAVWQHSRSYDPEKGSFEKWLGGVTRYKALTYKRKYLNRQQAAGLEEIQEPGEESQELSQLVEELSDETEAFLSCLKEEDRFLFRQLFIEEMEPDEVARKTGIKRENLYNRISRGKKKIRRHFPRIGQEKGSADYERFI